MLESTGLPLPGETALVLASAYAGATGHLSIAYVIAAAITGAIIGDNFGYWIGRRVGAQLLPRWGQYIGLTPNRLILGEYLFERHGGKIVFFGRFIAILRVFAAFLAGLNKYDWRSFLIFNASGAVVWALVFGIGAYLFGDAMTRFSGPLGIIALVGLVLGLFVFWLVMRHQEKKWEEKLTNVALDEEQGKLERREPNDAA
ncbi:MAG: DedA family protein [Beijerinckiaceae bacterium]|nr:MAG: DedA family protein [Beijerinckiaceae bacterium]